MAYKVVPKGRVVIKVFERSERSLEPSHGELVPINKMISKVRELTEFEYPPVIFVARFSGSKFVGPKALLEVDVVIGGNADAEHRAAALADEELIGERFTPPQEINSEIFHKFAAVEHDKKNRDRRLFPLSRSGKAEGEQPRQYALLTVYCDTAETEQATTDVLSSPKEKD